jgi:hypothetical protein
MIDFYKTGFGDHNRRGGETSLGFNIFVGMLRISPEPGIRLFVAHRPPGGDLANGVIQLSGLGVAC